LEGVEQFEHDLLISKRTLPRQAILYHTSVLDDLVHESEKYGTRCAADASIAENARCHKLPHLVTSSMRSSIKGFPPMSDPGSNHNRSLCIIESSRPSIRLGELDRFKCSSRWGSFGGCEHSHLCWISFF
jgi:hypothetical protein